MHLVVQIFGSAVIVIDLIPGMAPHLMPAEIDFLLKMAARGENAVTLHRRLAAQRARRGMESPNVTNIRKLLKGATYNRGATETRGRAAKPSRANVLSMNRVR